MYENILYEVADGVATITLNQPDKRNALSHPMLDDLVDAFGKAQQDAAVRVAVLTGAGDVFSAGGDLSGFSADVPLAHKHYGTTRFLDLFRGSQSSASRRSARPTGTSSPAASAWRSHATCVASDEAKFSTPEINIGLFPFMIMAIIYRNVPRKKVNEMLLLGERLSADEAVNFGLINKAVPPTSSTPATDEWAKKLAAKAPVVMRLGHDSMVNQQDLPYFSARVSAHAVHRGARTEDAIEGAMAFFEKREPEWKGR